MLMWHLSGVPGFMNVFHFDPLMSASRRLLKERREVIELCMALG